MARIVTYSLNPALDLACQLHELRPGEVNRGQATRLDAAGKGINVARVLRSLGHSVSVGGFLGADNQTPFQKAFAELGLLDHFVRVPGATRINVKLSEAAGRVTDINGPGVAIDEQAWTRLLQALPAQVASADAVVVAGSLPPGLDGARFGEFLRQLGQLDVPVWLDTSGAGLASALDGGVNLLKPNEQELAELLGAPLPTLDEQLAAATGLVASARLPQVLLSLGEHGVYWASTAGALRTLPPKVAVISTVCAGDTLLAGVLHGVLSGWSRERSLRYATALAADCVRHIGPGNPAADDFEQLLEQTRLLPLNPPIVAVETQG